MRLACIGLTVADLQRAEAFFRDGLGFVRDHADGRSLRMRLGGQIIALSVFDPPGLPYPRDSDAADIRFQHFAIVVRDMRAAHERVRARPGCTPISHGGPQVLPPETGSVVAWKFRDPDGHPLELLHVPQRAPPPGDALCLGIDHSAIVVADVERSIAFYTGQLGLSVTSRSHNVGPAQQCLDGLPDADVDVVGLAPAGAATPHVELLGYRVPAPKGSAAAPLSDLAATRLTLETDDLAALLGRLRGAGTRIEDGDGMMLVRDPDGHALLLHQD